MAEVEAEEVHEVPLVEGRLALADKLELGEVLVELVGDVPVADAVELEQEAMGVCCYAAEQYAFPYCLRQWPWFSR